MAKQTNKLRDEGGKKSRWNGKQTFVGTFSFLCCFVDLFDWIRGRQLKCNPWCRYEIWMDIGRLVICYFFLFFRTGKVRATVLCYSLNKFIKLVTVKKNRRSSWSLLNCTIYLAVIYGDEVLFDKLLLKNLRAVQFCSDYKFFENGNW